MGNCNDFTSFDKVFDAPESLREISPRFQARLSAVGFYDVRLSCLDWVQVQVQTAEILFFLTRSIHLKSMIWWLLRQIGTSSAVQLGRHEIVRKTRNNSASSWADMRRWERQAGHSRSKANWPRWRPSALFPQYHCLVLSTSKGDKKGMTWLQLQLSTCFEKLDNLNCMSAQIG